jgi:hypothetical protein
MVLVSLEVRRDDIGSAVPPFRREMTPDVNPFLVGQALEESEDSTAVYNRMEKRRCVSCAACRPPTELDGAVVSQTRHSCSQCCRASPSMSKSTIGGHYHIDSSSPSPETEDVRRENLGSIYCHLDLWHGSTILGLRMYREKQPNDPILRMETRQS